MGAEIEQDCILQDFAFDYFFPISSQGIKLKFCLEGADRLEPISRHGWACAIKRKSREILGLHPTSLILRPPRPVSKS